VVTPGEGAYGTPHVSYCMLGLSEREDRKFFLWPQWEPCFLLLDEILAPFRKRCRVKSDQVYEIPLPPRKGDSPDTRRITNKTVPLGKLKWTYEDNRKWSQSPLQTDSYPIYFFDTVIDSSDCKGGPPSIYVYVQNGSASPDSKFNQKLVLTVSERFFGERSADSWTQLIRHLAPHLRSVRIGRTIRPWQLYRPSQNPGVPELSCLVDAPFAKRSDTLDLEDSWHPTWEYLA